MLTQHDWVHVLADYGTTVEAEVEVFGLIARANDDMHAFSLLAMVISLFETGYLETGAGLFEHSEGHFSSSPHMEERLADADAPRCRLPRRGDGTRQRRLPHDGLVRRRRIAPAPTCGPDSTWCPSRRRPREAGSVGPWEPGGISPFQLAAGRALADERTGVPYDAHGASA